MLGGEIKRRRRRSVSREERLWILVAVSMISTSNVTIIVTIIGVISVFRSICSDHFSRNSRIFLIEPIGLATWNTAAHDRICKSR